MLSELIYRLAKSRILSATHHDSGVERGRRNIDEYRAWRESIVRQSLYDTFDKNLFKDKDILDLGSGSGETSFALIEAGAKSVVGMDISENYIRMSREKYGPRQIQNLSFELASSTKSIDRPDDSTDLIFCFDVMEHIIEYEPIMAEWRRVLRKNGQVAIFWQPYYHPYGHHLYDYIPVPWIHVLLNNRQIDDICDRIAKLPEFNRPFWATESADAEATTKPSKGDSEFLNKLTLRRFEKLYTDLGFWAETRTFESFTGPKPVAAVSRVLTTLPLAREFFTANAIYILRVEK